jgi:WD40-like Beta Propeller Repeat
MRLPRLAAVSFIVVSACQSETTRPAEGGTLRVLVRTSGASLDRDGYALHVGPSEVSLQAQDSLDIPDVPLGRIPLALSGLADNCRAFTYPPPAVEVESEEIIRIPLVISCDSALRNVILFERWVDNTTPELWLMHPDGSGRQRFLTNARGGVATPNGTRVVYQDWSRGGLSVMLADRSRHWNPVPDLHGSIIDPDLSPDGDTLVVAASTEGVWDLYRAAMDGSDIRRLTTNADAVEPRWSPDGKFITFHTQDVDWRVYIMPSTGGEAVPLTEPVSGCCARWSPAGDRLLFWHGSLAGLWTMRPDGSEASALEPFSNALTGEWSPDGTEILAKFSGGTIRRVTLDGEETVILSEEGDEVGRWLR